MRGFTIVVVVVYVLLLECVVCICTACFIAVCICRCSLFVSLTTSSSKLPMRKLSSLILKLVCSCRRPIQRQWGQPMPHSAVLRASGRAVDGLFGFDVNTAHHQQPSWSDPPEYQNRITQELCTKSAVKLLSDYEFGWFCAKADQVKPKVHCGNFISKQLVNH